MDFSKTTITKIDRPGPRYAVLHFQGDRPIQGEPGQFVMIRGAWGVNPILPRAFSLVESGKGGAVLVMDVGVGTNLLCNMKVGDPLTVLGPLGNRYTGPTEGRRPILVAGGVGVAPLVFWANRLAAAGQQPIFVYGARTAGDLPLSEEIAKSARLLITTEDGSVGEKGLVTAPLTRLLADGGQYQVYSCGPDRMLEAVFGAAQAHESPCQVALESPMACGLGTCKGCAVVGADGSFKYVCSDGPVFEGATIYGGVR